MQSLRRLTHSCAAVPSSYVYIVVHIHTLWNRIFPSCSESEGERIWQACGKLGLFGMRVNSVNLPEIKRMKSKVRGETRFPLSFLCSKQGFATMAPSTRDAVELADGRAVAAVRRPACLARPRGLQRGGARVEGHAVGLNGSTWRRAQFVKCSSCAQKIYFTLCRSRALSQWQAVLASMGKSSVYSYIANMPGH